MNRPWTISAAPSPGHSMGPDSNSRRGTAVAAPPAEGASRSSPEALAGAAVAGQAWHRPSHAGPSGRADSSPRVRIKGRSLEGRKVQVAFGSALLAILVVGATAYRGMVLSRESVRWVRHTDEVVDGLQGLVIAMESVES